MKPLKAMSLLSAAASAIAQTATAWRQPTFHMPAAMTGGTQPNSFRKKGPGRRHMHGEGKNTPKLLRSYKNRYGC